MDASKRDELPVLPITYIHSDYPTTSRAALYRTRSSSTSSRTNFSEYEQGPLRSRPSHANRNRELVFHPPQRKTNDAKMERCPSIENNHSVKNENLLKSGQLGTCNDPFCITCPENCNVDNEQKNSTTPDIIDAKYHNMIHGDTKGWAKRMCSCLLLYVPGVMNPHAILIQKWNKIFVISCLFAIFIDPLFIFLLRVQQDNKCIVLNMPMTKTLVVLRSITDFICLIHIFLQFRLAYVAPEPRVTGTGDFVDDPKKIARNYLSGYFCVDLFIVLPLPQIIILLILSNSVGSSEANFLRLLLGTVIFVQYLTRLCRFLPFVADSSPIGFIFESIWFNFFWNLLTIFLFSHIVGSWWYFFGLQRVNQCFRNACRDSTIAKCARFIDCGRGNSDEMFRGDPAWDLWKTNVNATACLSKDGFEYGIFEAAVNLTAHKSVATRYVYSLFWGFQQTSTLAGNQVPSYSLPEVLFTMVITCSGLLLYTLVIGNIQNFTVALGRRKLEMSLRQREVEKWMSQRRLPEALRSQVRDSERFNRAATSEAMMMEKLPENLQRDIRHHFFIKFVKKVRIFQHLDEPVIDAICERLRTKTYIKGSKILFRGGLVDKMVFMIRGHMESIGDDQIVVPLSEGDVCGEELLTWCLEHSSLNKDGKTIRIQGHRLLSNRLVWCLTNVEAFILLAADLEEVISLFARSLRIPRAQRAIRYESPYWRALPVKRIQVAWRYRKKRISRVTSSHP